MSDLIDRQSAIEAIGEKSDEIYKTKQKGATYPHNDFFQGMAYAEDVVKQLPSALSTNLASLGTDLISRQAAIDAIRAYLSDCCVEDGDYHASGIEYELNDLPSAQPEPKRGKWERHYCKDGNPDGWQCDKCKEWYYFGQTLPNFCPNCGADMRGEHDG